MPTPPTSRWDRSAWRATSPASRSRQPGAALPQLARLSVLNTSPTSLGINQRAHWNIDFAAAAAGDPVAHYSEGYKTFDGLAFPTHRRVYRRNPGSTPTAA